MALVPYVADNLAFVRTALNLLAELPVVLYVGPDQFLPLASVLSAIAGLALMFWNKVVAFATKCWTLVSRRGRRADPGKPPIEDRA